MAGWPSSVVMGNPSCRPVMDRLPPPVPANTPHPSPRSNCYLENQLVPRAPSCSGTRPWSDRPVPFLVPMMAPTHTHPTHPIPQHTLPTPQHTLPTPQQALSYPTTHPIPPHNTLYPTSQYILSHPTHHHQPHPPPPILPPHHSTNYITLNPPLNAPL